MGAPRKLLWCRSALLRSASSAPLICAGEGNAKALGMSGQSTAAVATETVAVAALISASAP